METWKDAGVPLESVLRGIDATFEKWERRPRKTRKVNGLAYCAQEVLASAEEMKEAAVGARSQEKRDTGLDHAAVVEFLRRNAERLEHVLTVAEEKLFAALLAATPDEALLRVRSEADRDLAPYRRKMTAPQIEQLHKQYVHKRLLDQHHVPRLSLFYM